MSTDRLHHLDFLRASMMFLGVFVHSSHSDFDSGDFEWIRYSSNLFRMGCFFIISGYFSLLVFERQKLTKFLQQRSIMICIPAIFCTALLVPLTIKWMNLYFEHGGYIGEYNSSWLGHTWFLVSLFFYTLLVPVIALFLKSTLTIKIVSLKLPIKLVIILSLLVAYIIFTKLVLKAIYGVPLFESVYYTIGSTLRYFPAFVFGALMYRWNYIYEKAHQTPILWFTIATALVLGKIFIPFEVTNLGTYILHSLLEIAVALSISAALFSISIRFINRGNAIIRSMADSAYTVYLIHYFIIAITLLILQKSGANILTCFLLSGTVATVFGYLFHMGVVRNNDVMKLLLNGKIVSKKKYSLKNYN